MARAGLTISQDPSTIPGSPEYISATLVWLRNTLKSAESDCVPVARHIPHYRKWAVDHGRDWDAFCREELDAEPEWIAAIERGVAVLERRGHVGPISSKEATTAAQIMAAAEPLGPAHAEKGSPTRNPTGRKGKNKGSDATQDPKERGSSYLASRIRRDAPEIASAVERGEYPSIRAAAIAAGIVKVATPEQKAEKALAKLEEPARAALVAPKLTVDAVKDWLRRTASDADRACIAHYAANLCGKSVA